MGLWAKVKGWLNIGGVDVKLWKYTEPLSKSNPVLRGAVLLKTKTDKVLKGVEVKVVEELTTTEEEDGEKKKKTKTKVLGSAKFPDHEPGLGYPFELKAGENKEQAFTVNVTLTTQLQNMGGVIGGLGKLAAFAASEKLEYFLVAEASVQGAVFKPSDKQKLKIGP